MPEQEWVTPDTQSDPSLEEILRDSKNSQLYEIQDTTTKQYKPQMKILKRNPNSAGTNTIRTASPGSSRNGSSEKLAQQQQQQQQQQPTSSGSTTRATTPSSAPPAREELSVRELKYQKAREKYFGPEEGEAAEGGEGDGEGPEGVPKEASGAEHAASPNTHADETVDGAQANAFAGTQKTAVVSQNSVAIHPSEYHEYSRNTDYSVRPVLGGQYQQNQYQQNQYQQNQYQQNQYQQNQYQQNQYGYARNGEMATETATQMGNMYFQPYGPPMGQHNQHGQHHNQYYAPQQQQPSLHFGLPNNLQGNFGHNPQGTFSQNSQTQFWPPHKQPGQYKNYKKNQRNQKPVNGTNFRRYDGYRQNRPYGDAGWGNAQGGNYQGYQNGNYQGYQNGNYQGYQNGNYQSYQNGNYQNGQDSEK